MQTPIYLDHQATCPVDDRVLEVMLPVFTRDFGNAASRTHAFGWRAEELVETARAQVADCIGANPAEIVFTSGATEALNLALKGAADLAPPDRRHLITSKAEHSAVLDTVACLETRGFRVTRLDPDGEGVVHPDQLRAALTSDTFLVALMWANNEVGSLNPIRELGALCRERGILFLTDATQAVGKLPVDLGREPVDLLSLTAHKLYGPKGAGALYVRRGVRLALQQHGGGQEHGLRSGTLNVPGIVGLGEACRLAADELEAEAQALTRLRLRLETGIRTGLGGPAERDRNDKRETDCGVHLNGAPQRRLPGCLHLSFDGIAAEDLMRAVPEVAFSSGSACGSGRNEPSHVLRAMGLSHARAHGSVRFGLGRSTTEEQIDFVAARIVAAVQALRAQDPARPWATSGSEPTYNPTG